jgi:hypothetical protein
MAHACVRTFTSFVILSDCVYLHAHTGCVTPVQHTLTVCAPLFAASVTAYHLASCTQGPLHRLQKFPGGLYTGQFCQGPQQQHLSSSRCQVGHRRLWHVRVVQDTRC